MKTPLLILSACLLWTGSDMAMAAATASTAAAAKASAAEIAAQKAAQKAQAEANTAEDAEAQAAAEKAKAAAEAAAAAKTAAEAAAEAVKAAARAEAAAKAAREAKAARAKAAAENAALKEELAKKAAAEAERRGTSSCNDWLEERDSKAGKDGKGPAALWLIGYLSGIAVAKNHDFLTGTNNDALYSMVDEYCHSHPLEYTSDAGIHLYLDLARKKRLIE